MISHDPSPMKASAADWAARAAGFAVLVLIIFSQPSHAVAGLDPSWGMSLGRFFAEGRQFGTEVVFTYGPLGFLMGKIYNGQQFASMITWQWLQAIIFAGILFWHGFRLSGYARFFFFVAIGLWCATYQDLLHQTIIAFLGLELIRRAGGPWRWSSAAMLLLMAFMSLFKFTNFMLASVMVVIATAESIRQSRRAADLKLALFFGGAFILGWILCRQNPLNLPAYIRASWEISSGYQDTMGIPTPSTPLLIGLAVFALIIAYAGLSVWTRQAERGRGIALALGTGAFLFLTWKHGFIRSDGHMVGFFYAALAVVVCHPFLLQDNVRLQRVKRSLLAVAAILSVVGIDVALPGVAHAALGNAQHRVLANIRFALRTIGTKEEYDSRFAGEKSAYDLERVRKAVGRATVDVLGYEQSVAIFNGLNYSPRPVFQSYSAYTPYLARLNHAFYASDQAPEYVLFKFQTIDERFPTLDDSGVLALLMHRYDYVLTEGGYHLLRRKEGDFHPANVAPRMHPPRQFTPGTPVDIAELGQQTLWAEIDLRPSVLGRLRRFIYKPPFVHLRVTDQHGDESVYRVPPPLGKAGFILNPLIEDAIGYMRMAGGQPLRYVRSITIDVAPTDRKYFARAGELALGVLPTTEVGRHFFEQAEKSRFHMFKAVPVSYEAKLPVNEGVMEHQTVITLHAPSEMVFEVPRGAKSIKGRFGISPNAYAGDNRTDGAEFQVAWSGGDRIHVLYQRFLDPLKKVGDQGLHDFSVELPASNGRVYLRITPGPHNNFSWDWTVWTGIEFE